MLSAHRRIDFLGELLKVLNESFEFNHVEIIICLCTENSALDDSRAFKLPEVLQHGRGGKRWYGNDFTLNPKPTFGHRLHDGNSCRVADRACIMRQLQF